MVRQSDSIPDNLVYLHDAKCSEITWDCSNPDCRSIRMIVIVDIDAGLPMWDGKQLQITLSDVLAIHFIGWGFVIGDEVIDDWRSGVSDFLEGECKSLHAKGIGVPSLRYTISFSSGSTLEVVCAEVFASEKP